MHINKPFPTEKIIILLQKEVPEDHEDAPTFHTLRQELQDKDSIPETEAFSMLQRSLCNSQENGAGPSSNEIRRARCHNILKKVFQLAGEGRLMAVPEMNDIGNTDALI